jgi:hypothetical protein
MPTQVLSPGGPYTLTQNIVYALPAKRCLIFTDTAGVTLQQSNTVAFTANIAITLVDGQKEVAGGFIRSTAGDCNLTVRAL